MEIVNHHVECIDESMQEYLPKRRISVAMEKLIL
jgi:hypothetical protein